MPELPSINEDFTADASGYLAALQAMIDKTQQLTNQVNELHAAIDALPDVKNIEINITGTAVATLTAIREDLDALDDRTIVVNIVYKNIGGPDTIKEATQVVQQVVLPGNDTVKQQEQIIQQVDQNMGGNEGTEGFDQAAAAAHELDDELVGLRKEYADLAIQSGITREEAVKDFDEVAATMRAMGNTADEVNQAITEENAKLSDSINRINDDTAEEGVSFSKLSGMIREAQAGIFSYGAATDSSTVKNNSFDDSIQGVLNKLAAENLSAKESAAILAQLAYSMQSIGQHSEETAHDMSIFATMIESAGGDVDKFESRVADGSSMLIAFSSAIHDAGSSVGAAMIPLSAASFGITGIATAIHLVVMGTFEFLAVFLPAMFAAGAAALVMMQGVGVVSDGLKSMYTATEALGPALGTTAGDMLGLGHSLQTAQNVANPGVYELLGEALIGVKEATGPTTQGLSSFGQMGLDVEHILEGFAAKIDIDLRDSMGQLRGLISGGVQDLVEFGQILGNIGHSILNLASDMPGLAEIVLKVVDALSQLLKWISDLPPMLITVVMGIEEAYRWSGLLAGVFGVLGRAFALIGTLGIPVFAKIGMNFGAMVASMLSGVAGLVANLATGFAKIAEVAGTMAKAMDAEALAGGIDAAATAVEGASIGIIGALSKAAAFMTTGWGAAIALAVVGLGILVWWLSRSAPTATEIFIANINKAVAAASNLTVLNVIGNSMAQVTNHIAQQGTIMAQSMHQAAESAQATVGPYQSSAAAAQSNVGPYNSVAINAGHLSDAQKKAADSASESVGPYNSQTNAVKAAAQQVQGAVGVYGTVPSAAAAAGIATQELTQEQQKLFSQATQVIGGAQGISKAYGTSFASSLGIADLAGVNLSNTQVILGNNANAAGIKIEGLVQGYEKMGQTGSILSNSMAAVNVQAGLQASKVSALNQAWDQFMTMAQSLTGGIASVNADLSQMGNIAPVVGSKIQALSGGTQMSVSQISQSLKSFSGQSAQTWQSYNSSLTAAEQFTSSLRTGMSAGVVSGTEYRQSIASVAQEFLPYAANSKAARSELDVLLQEAGQPFTSNFSQMKSWIDKNALSTSNFSGLIQTLTGKLSNVTAVAQNFAGTLQSDVIGAMAQAAVGTANITGLTSNYTKQLSANGAGAASTKAAQNDLNAALGKLGFSTADIQQLDAELTTGYGKQSTAAKTLKQNTDDVAGAVSNLGSGKLPVASAAMDTLKSHTDDAAKSMDPGLSGHLNSAGSAADGLKTPHLSALQTAMDTVKAHSDITGQAMDPGLTGKMNSAASGADDLRTPHLSAAQSALDTIKDHTDQFGQHLDPGLTNSIGTTASRMDDWRSSHIGPAQAAIDTIKAHTDTFGGSMDPGLTGKLANAGSASDNLHNNHLTPLQQIVKDLNTFVGDFESAMGKWPSSEHTNVNVTGSGSTKINSTIPGVSGGTIDLSGKGLGLAGGGVLPGFAPGIDSIPALLSPGEGVLVPEAVRAMGGEKVINDINHMTRAHFASGGVASEAALEALTKTGRSTTHWWDAAMRSKSSVMHKDAKLLTEAMKGMSGKHGTNAAENDMVADIDAIQKFFTPAPETAAHKMARLIGIGEHSGVPKAMVDAKVLAAIISNKKLSSKTKGLEEGVAETALEHELHLLHEQHLQHFAGGGIALPNVTGWAEGTLGTATTDITNGFKSVITSAINQMKQQEMQLAAGPAGGATGSEMANGLELYQYLLANVFGGSKIAAAGATASIYGECVTEDHEILTKRGWLTHDEVREGDETIGYNPETGRSEWTRVNAVMHYQQKPVVEYVSKSWSATFTPNHRWLTENDGPPVIKQFMDFAPDDRLVLSRPADTGEGLPITEKEAAILGWMTSHDECRFISAEDGDDLIARVGDPRTDAAYQVIQMSEMQRKSWLVTALASEGTTQERAVAREKLYKNGIAEAVNLALYLEGYEPPKEEAEPEPEVREVSGFKDVWCVKTSLGTWTTKHGATWSNREAAEKWGILTGNSAWNPLTSGTGGRGLIGWTPEGTISNAAFSGGMRTQLPAIIQFINSSGDWGTIQRMKSATSVYQAAEEWGKGVERYGIDDVHAEGVALATSFMNSGGNAAPATGLARAINHASRSTQDAGGWIYPGMNIVDNHTGQIERTVPPGQGSGDGNVLHATFQIDGKSVFEAMAPIAYQKASRQNGNSNASAYWAPGNKR